MIRQTLVLLLAGVLLAACASGPAYRPAQEPDDYGYRDTRLTDDRYRVSFAGSYGTARETVDTFALFRAADVALANGYTRFRIVSRETSPIVTNRGGGPTTSIGYGYGWGYPFFGTSIGYSGGGYSRTRYESVLEIQVGPEVPEEGADVYDAEALKRNLAANVAAAIEE